MYLPKFLALSFTAIFALAHHGTAGDVSWGDMAATFSEIFGGHKSFTTTADIQSSGGKQQIRSFPVQMQWLDGRGRLEVDLTTIESSQLPKEQLAGIKKAGLEKVVAIVDSSARTVHLISPGLKAYASQDLNKSTDGSTKKVTVKKTALGKETIDGQACTKNKLTVSDGENTHDLTTWNSSSLKGFPIKMQMTEKDQVVTVSFKDTKLNAPATAELKPPADFTKHNTVQELFAAAMGRLITSGQ